MSEEVISKKEVDFKNISKVANVEVTLSAELGKATISLKDAIECDEGSVIVLDRANNEPIDVYVDDILIAKAQIVAIEDSYGIKIVEIIDNKNKTKEE